MTTSSALRLAIVILALPLTACTTTPGSSGDDTTANIAQYVALQQQLDANRTEFLPTGMRTPAAVGSRLMWTDYGGSSTPPLASYNEQTGARLTYGFSIGDATSNNVNYRASADLIVTTDESNVYQVYSAAQADQLVGQFSLTPPTDEQKWWPYAVDGTTVYVLTTGTSTELLRWQPGDSAPTTMFALEDAGITVGELWDFDVIGNDSVVIESGAVWHLDLAAKTSVRIPAQNQLDPSDLISFDDRGILYTAQGGQVGDLLYYSLGAGKLTDVSAAIEANAFQINTTFAQAHYYQSGGVLDGEDIVYVGDSGLFKLNLTSNIITPVLLSPHQVGLRIDYGAPAVLDSGDIYAVGFTSTDGAVGFEGPIYKVSAQ